MTWVFFGFSTLYVLALLAFVVSVTGLFGAEGGPLSGIFLVPLGLPWNVLLDRLGLEGVLMMVLAPLPNAAILWWLWRR